MSHELHDPGAVTISTADAEWEAGEQDYTDAVVPQSVRRPNWKMLLTFLSMQATFGAVYVGYTARFEGLSFQQLIIAMAIATAAMSLYCVASANAGAVVGQTSAVMTRGIFGRFGSRIVSLLLVIDGMGFYVFTVLFVMSLVGGLFDVPAVKAVTVGLAVVMIVNTYFGFSGVQRFAQFVAVPVVLLWGIYATIKGLGTVDSGQLHTPLHVQSPSSILFVTGAMVGLSTWGNEADIFRYAKTRRQWNVPTIVISYAVGSFVFPIMGYCIAVLSGQSDFGPSIKYFVDFSLFGATLLGLIFFVINQWAVNDGNLYIAVNGAQNLLSAVPRWQRRYTVIGLGLIAGALTLIMPSLTQTFNIVTGIGSVTVPTASTIMAVDVFLLHRLTGRRRPMHRVARWHETAAANWPAIVALIAGTGVGAFTGGLVPGTPGFQHTYIGFPALQAWVTGAVVYIIGVLITRRRRNVETVLGFPQIEDVAQGPAVAAAPGLRTDRRAGTDTPVRQARGPGTRQRPAASIDQLEQKVPTVMEPLDVLIRADRVITVDGERPAAVGITAGRIALIDTVDADLQARVEHRLAAHQVLLPGLVDTHVHLQDPGHTSWEDFNSGTRAAAAGGITTLVDMPLDSLPVTVDTHALATKIAAATGRIHVDVGFWAGLTPDNLDQLTELHAAGVLGFKCFLANTGLPEFPPISPDTLRSALTRLKTLNVPLLVHAEDADAMDAEPAVSGSSYPDFLSRHPAHIEERAVATVIAAVRDTGGSAHIVHVSTASAATLIQDAQQEGLPITAETCPHYLAIAAEEVPPGNTRFKVCPPIRDGANRDGLWSHLESGTLAMVVSDHSPCPLEDKHLDTGDFGEAFGGVTSLQVSLPVVWTHARQRGHTLSDVVGWMATRPAEWAGLPQKGAIDVGKDADFCVFSPDETFLVDDAELHHRQPLTPYAGRQLHGVVEQTWLRGEPIAFDTPRGQPIRRA